MIALAFATWLWAAAGEEPTLTATWSATSVQVGEHVKLDVELRGECAVDAELLELPAVESATLTLESGPEYSSTDAYRCSWRIDVLARRAGSLEFTLRVQCQSAEERTVRVPALTIGGDGAIEPDALFTLTPSQGRVFVGEPFAIDVDVRIGLAAFASGYDVVLPWFHDVIVVGTEAALDPVTFSIEGEAEPLRLSRRASGDALAARTTLRVAVPQAGRLTWAGSRLRPRARAGSRPAGSEATDVAASPGGVDVLPLPTAGRPTGHVDAIGVWSVRSRADRVDVAVGEPIRVDVVIEAQPNDAGNLSFATLPSTWSPDGCRTILRDERRDANARTLTFEVRPTRAGAEQIEAFEVATFDPRSQRYVVARSTPIPLRVTAEAQSPATPVAEAERSHAVPVVAGAVVAAIAAWFVARRRRVRAESRQRSDPWLAFERTRSSCAPDDPLAASKAFAHACAVTIGIDVGALAGGGARSALRSAGVDEPLAERVAAWIDVGEEAAFASPKTRDASLHAKRLDEARALVEALLRERSKDGASRSG